jgi:DNA-binding transcriptional regulator YhcF (GntR family)
MNKIKGDYVMIPDKYWKLKLDIYQTNILARIMSWQRTDKVFFESYESIAEKFNISRITVQRKFESLEKLGLIKRGPKVKRTWSWKANEVAISNLLDKLLRVTNSKRNVTESNNICNSDDHYNNPKNINKNILREEEEPFVGSSFPSKEDMELKAMILAKELDV